MSSLSSVVARRYLTGGTLQVPPAMLKSISDWVFSVILESRREFLQSQTTLSGSELIDLEESSSTLKHLGGELNLRILSKKPRAAWGSYGALLKYLARFNIQQPDPISYKDFVAWFADGTLYSHIDSDLYEAGRRLQLVLDKDRKFRRNLSLQLDLIKKAQPIKAPSALKDSVTQTFSFDATGWSYLKFHNLRDFIPSLIQKYRGLLGPLADMMMVEGEDGVARTVEGAVADAVEKWGSITVMVIPNYSSEGSWTPTTRTLKVRLPGLVTSFAHLMFPIDKMREEVNTTVRHELQHMVQTYLALALGGVGSERDRPSGRGFPTRKQQTPLFRQELDNGRIVQDEWLLDQRGKALRSLVDQGVSDPSRVSLHALDDVEFHTRMEDSKQELKRILDRRPPELEAKRVFRIFAGLEPVVKDYSDPYSFIPKDIFMGTLAKVPSAKEKYRRALVELARVVH